MVVLLLAAMLLPARAAERTVVLLAGFEALGTARERVELGARVFRRELALTPGIVVVTPAEAEVAAGELLLPAAACAGVDPACAGQLAEALGADVVVTGQVAEGPGGTVLTVRLYRVVGGADTALEQPARSAAPADLETAAAQLAGRLAAHLTGENR